MQKFTLFTARGVIRRDAVIEALSGDAVVGAFTHNHSYNYRSELKAAVSIFDFVQPYRGVPLAVQRFLPRLLCHYITKGIDGMS